MKNKNCSKLYRERTQVHNVFKQTSIGPRSFGTELGILCSRARPRARGWNEKSARERERGREKRTSFPRRLANDG